MTERRRCSSLPVRPGGPVKPGEGRRSCPLPKRPAIGGLSLLLANPVSMGDPIYSSDTCTHRHTHTYMHTHTHTHTHIHITFLDCCKLSIGIHYQWSFRGGVHDSPATQSRT